MSLPIAIQSVLYYVLSCSTCSKISHRRAAKAQAKKERAEKSALETEQPGLYRHPSPFSTNPHWEEEIAMGPSNPRKKMKKDSKNPSHRDLVTAGPGSSMDSEGSTNVGSSPTMVADDARSSADGWNRKRYQREDEALWGRDIPGLTKPAHRMRDALTELQGSMSKKLEDLSGKLSQFSPTKEDSVESSPYFTPRNPPVNDLHPPIVSQPPTSKEATRWMLQPPPPAAVMEGKVPANRSRSASRGSSSRVVVGASLSRQVTGRAVEERLRRGEAPPELELPMLNCPKSRTAQGANTPLRQKSTRSAGRSRSSTLESDLSDTARPGRRRGVPSPFSLAVDRRVSIDSIEDNDRPPLDKKESARPQLETIMSTETNLPRSDSSSKRLNKSGVETPKLVLGNLSNFKVSETDDKTDTDQFQPSLTTEVRLNLPAAMNAMPASIPHFSPDNPSKHTNA